MKKSTLLKIISITFVLFFSIQSAFADLDDTSRNKIPDSYYSRCDKSGKTQLFKYKTNKQYKSAIVYTPYNYNPDDKNTKYPVLYLMHGGGGTAESYIGPATSPNSLCWIIDNAIKNGDIKPVIIVCPNHSGGFYAELRNYLIPAIDENFNTLADREHRIFGGFSMGSVETWNVFLHDLDLVKYFIPMSGDSWVCGTTGGKNFPEKTSAFLAKADNIDKFKSFKIFAATGTADTAYPNLTPQIQAMKKETGVFKYTTKNFSKGNLIYYVVPGNVHSYNHTFEYIYNALKLFK